MKFKTAKAIQSIKEQIRYEECYDGEKNPPEDNPSQIVLSKLEFERALLMAYGMGITAGKKNPNEVV